MHNSPRRNVVPIADQLIGDGNRRANVLFANPVRYGVSPPTRQPSSVRTSTRVPAMTGLPWQPLGISLDSLRNHLDMTSPCLPVVSGCDWPAYVIRRTAEGNWLHPTHITLCKLAAPGPRRHARSGGLPCDRTT